MRNCRILPGPLSALALSAALCAPAKSQADDQAADAIRGMSRQIDRRIVERLQRDGLTPGTICEDAEFLRRVSLDLTGVIPSVAEVREFLADGRPDKRALWIDRLLASPRHATHLAIRWRRILLPSDFDPNQLNQAAGLQSWLYRQFVDNLRYDRLVAEFLSSTGDQQTGPALFYRSLEAEPEKLAAVTSRVFLGLQIECAQCHDHPFDEWTQRDFWGYAAFFAQLQPGSSMGRDGYRLVDLPTGEVTLPMTEEVVAPQFPSGRRPGEHARGTRRRQLAIWMASRDNPFLAPAAVNRVWEQLFGRGLVNPVDDLGEHNPATHPKLFSELAQFFTDQGFDLRALYRCLANTEAYQRSSRLADGKSARLADYTHMPVKRMTAEQLFDSLHRSLSIAGGVPGPGDPARRQFVARMDSASRDLTEYDLGIQQVLEMMNGERIARSTERPDHGILAALEAPFFGDTERVDVLYLATVSRLPTDTERGLCLDIVQAGESPGEAWGDILWALLNCAEYQFNH